MSTNLVRVVDVMRREFDLLDGRLTVREALAALRHPEAGAILVDKRSIDDEYGIVRFSDIARRILGANHAPERVSLYEVMSKPTLTVRSGMDIRYCARLLDRFGVSCAPVVDDGRAVGLVDMRDLVLGGVPRS